MLFILVKILGKLKVLNLFIFMLFFKINSKNQLNSQYLLKEPLLQIEPARCTLTERYRTPPPTLLHRFFKQIQFTAILGLKNFLE